MSKLSGKAKANARKKAAQQIAKQKVAEKQKLIEQQYQEHKELKVAINEFSKATGATVVANKDRPYLRVMEYNRKEFRKSLSQ